MQAIIKYEGHDAAMSTESESVPRNAHDTQSQTAPISAPTKPLVAIQQAVHDAANAQGRPLESLEILNDTQGVDFRPYLKDVLKTVRTNWYSMIPESAEMKKGNLAIEFAITKDGNVAGMKLVATSGDAPLDRAAWGGITASNPFPPLPSEFGGKYLALRFRFYYNTQP